jgi:polyisoprenoid-binding protein YceI
MKKSIILSFILPFVLTTGMKLPAHSAQSQWKISPNNSFVKFRIKNMGMPVDGSFTKVTGDVDYDEHNLSAASVHANINTGSIKTGIGMRDGHLKSKDFFDVSKFPDAEFSSTKIVVNPNGGFQILGTLTLHGISQEVTLNAAPLKQKVNQDGHTHLVTSASANIKRKSFNIGGWTAATIGNDVNVDLTIDLIKAL